MGVRGLKRLLLAGATSPPAGRALRAVSHELATILMLHRFEDRERDVPGHDPAALRCLLARLRRERYPLVSLVDLFASLERREPLPPRAVAFTLDDGYADQAEIAAPVFAEFDCPATIFVTTGFLDGVLWFWWDQIAYVFDHTPRTAVTLELETGREAYDLADPARRTDAAERFTVCCKSVRDERKHRLIRALADAADVELPAKPPARYAPMSWAQLREWEGRGITFGPHTATHPILARADDAQAQDEIARSWNRLRAEARRPAPIFCYPNGQAGDFGEREFRILRDVGLAGAVTGVPGYAAPTTGPAWEAGRFRVPRFSYHDDVRSTLQYVNGFERLKQRLRGTA